jgi:ATP-dependent RNA helicase RhlE
MTTDAQTPTNDTPVPISFEQTGLHPLLLKAVIETGYTTPTPIQAGALPPVMAGQDVMGAAQTGTGKTAAFTLPLLHRLMPAANSSASPARHPVRALILTPTRELADQVYESVRRYSKYTPLRSAVVFGGVDIAPQKLALRNGCEVLIATPGRLLDHMEQRTVNLTQVSLLVLDEADRMLDMGFLPDLDRIIRALPATRQTLLFSATFGNDIRKLALTYMRQPVEIEVAKRNATAENVSQIAYLLEGEDKRAAVVQLVKSRGLKQVIVFSNTKIGTSRLALALEKDGVSAASIHGDKSQADRMKALEAFKSGELEVLVATDVAARGLDVAGVPCVINYDLPHTAEDYVHRIGRTGRAGASGEAISFYSPDEEKYLFDIEKLTRQPVPRAKLDLGDQAASAKCASASGDRTDRNGRGERPDRSERRSGPTARPTSSHEAKREPRSPSRGYVPKVKPIDEFFLKPYVPAVPATLASASDGGLVQKAVSNVKRPALGVLLSAKPQAKTD